MIAQSPHGAASRGGAPRQSAGPIDADLYRDAVWCQAQRDRCSRKDAAFVSSMVVHLSRGRRPSEKQARWLASIARRLRSGGAS